MEIERQVDELVSSGMVEEFKGSDFPKLCSCSFLVGKGKEKETKIAKTKRLARNFSNTPWGVWCHILGPGGGYFVLRVLSLEMRPFPFHSTYQMFATASYHFASQSFE